MLGNILLDLLFFSINAETNLWQILSRTARKCTNCYPRCKKRKLFSLSRL